MARKPARPPLNVYLNARVVGQLRRQSSGAIDFRYDPSWLAWDHSMPVSLSMPLSEDRYTGDTVIAVFDNLLPDDEPTRRRIAERVQADGYDAFNLLAKIGRDCVGALQFLPDGIEPEPAGKVDGRAVGEKYVARKITELATAPLGLNEDDEFRISLAGAQKKTSFLYWKNKWHVPHGTTATTHIMKPQIGILQNGIDLSRSVENEFLCLKITKAFGLPSAEVNIANFRGKRVLVVERFDRRWTEDGRLLRLPQEDCCQALSVLPTQKYEADGGPGMPQILDLLRGSDKPERDQRRFLKAQIIFWLLGATDGHAKNFSVFLDPGGRYRLAPLYDVMSVQPALDDRQIRRVEMKLAMAVGNNRHYVIAEILPRHFVQTADRAGIPDQMVEEIIREIIEDKTDAISNSLGQLPRNFPEDLAASVITGFRNRLQSLERHLKVV